jgi:peptidoglycan hydrolase-like protein with peptidoglycan-binding domain
VQGGAGTAHPTAAHSTQRAGTSRRGTSAARRRPAASNVSARARLHLQPERVQEIQQALIREGYLQGEANGQWDARTHDAMLRYQTMHGFSPTGLPEAKSLMKLGLGSHPLPPELDHSAVASASSANQNVFTVSPIAPASAPAGLPAQESNPPQER